MLDLRPSCECCDAPLPPESPLARICSFECTFCATCTERRLGGRCPNCGGELLPRPRRPAAKLATHPASTVRVFKPGSCAPGPIQAGKSAAGTQSVVVRRVAADEVSLIGPLTRLLTDAVHSGASVGFLAPLAAAAADRYWQAILSALGADTDLCLWVAEAGGQVVGAVQLALCPKENGCHRAEVQKLMVHTSQRGRGIAPDLMRRAEEEAASRGRSTLVLDTRKGDTAEKLYQRLGYIRAGEIPRYARGASGDLHATVFFYKLL